MATKFWKRQDADLTQIEVQVGTALKEIENTSQEWKNELKELFITNVKQYEILKDEKKAKDTLLVYVAYPCYQSLLKVQRKLVVELERRLKMNVLFTAKRTIQSKWIKKHKSQMRPRNRTLTAVYDAVLDDLCLPSTILGKRTRVRIDNSKFMKVSLDDHDKEFLGDKLDAIRQVYLKLTTRDVQFDFKPDAVFYHIKK